MIDTSILFKPFKVNGLELRTASSCRRWAVVYDGGVIDRVQAVCERVALPLH
jgi:hypothetical protein